jgi:hypothetical protein
MTIEDLKTIILVSAVVALFPLVPEIVDRRKTILAEWKAALATVIAAYTITWLMFVGALSLLAVVFQSIFRT